MTMRYHPAQRSLRFCRWCQTRSYLGGGRCANGDCLRLAVAVATIAERGHNSAAAGGEEHGAEWRHGPVRTQEPATPTVCTCGFCGAHWMHWGWRCDHAGVAYMASGRKVNLHHGARYVLAESLGVPPGLLCRRANTIVVAKTPGFIMSPAWEIECRVLERVGILPVEYYTDMIVMWSENYDVQIGMDSSVIVGGDVAFDLEKRDIVKIDYIVGHRPIVFHSGWIGCAPVCLTMGSDYRFAPNLVLLRAAPFAFSVRNYSWLGRRGGRCAKAMWHICARWRARRAVKAAPPRPRVRQRAMSGA